MARPPKWTATIIRAEAEALLAWLEQPDNVWFRAFALDRGYHHDYMAKWARRTHKDGTPRHPEFAAAWRQAQAVQEYRLIQGGLLSQYNPACVIFTLKNHHGWRDVREQINTDEVAERRTLRALLDEGNGHGLEPPAERERAPANPKQGAKNG